MRLDMYLRVRAPCALLWAYGETEDCQRSIVNAESFYMGVLKAVPRDGGEYSNHVIAVWITGLVRGKAGGRRIVTHLTCSAIVYLALP